jgi:uncharacterized membrane protein
MTGSATRREVSTPKVLDGAAALWGGVAILGILAFGAYILALYGVGVARGDLQRWNAVLPAGHGYVRDDPMGDIALGLHLLAASVITLTGSLQMLPLIRRRAPALHRWNGRIFLTVAMAAAATGLVIAFTRGPVAGAYMTAGNVLNAVLILTFGGLAWATARAGRIADHRRWALRTFIVTFSVWFYRLGMMLWFAVQGGPVGHNRAFTGPFDIFLAFGHVLAPLAFMELYLRVRDHGGQTSRQGMAALLVILSLATAAGTLLAVFGMWLPRL